MRVGGTFFLLLGEPRNLEKRKTGRRILCGKIRWSSRVTLPTTRIPFLSHKETFSTGVRIVNDDPTRVVELAERISEPFSEVAYAFWEPSYGLSK